MWCVVHGSGAAALGCRSPQRLAAGPAALRRSAIEGFRHKICNITEVERAEKFESSFASIISSPQRESGKGKGQGGPKTD